MGTVSTLSPRLLVVGDYRALPFTVVMIKVRITLAVDLHLSVLLPLDFFLGPTSLAAHMFLSFFAFPVFFFGLPSFFLRITGCALRRPTGRPRRSLDTNAGMGRPPNKSFAVITMPCNRAAWRIAGKFHGGINPDIPPGYSNPRFHRPIDMDVTEAWG